MNFKFLLVLVLIALFVLELDARKPRHKGKKGHRKPKGHHKGNKGLSLGFNFQLGNYHTKGEKGWGDLRLPKVKLIKPKIKFVPWRIKVLRPKLIVRPPKLKFYHRRR